MRADGNSKNKNTKKQNVKARKTPTTKLKVNHLKFTNELKAKRMASVRKWKVSIVLKPVGPMFD